MAKINFEIKENEFYIDKNLIKDTITPKRLVKIIGEPDRILPKYIASYSGDYIYDNFGLYFQFRHGKCKSICLNLKNMSNINDKESILKTIFSGELILNGVNFPSPKSTQSSTYISKVKKIIPHLSKHELEATLPNHIYEHLNIGGLIRVSVTFDEDYKSIENVLIIL